MLKTILSKITALFAAPHYSAPKPQVQATPPRSPVMEITDSPWGHDVAAEQAKDYQKWLAACKKVEGWRILWNMGYTNDVPSAFHKLFLTAERGNWDVQNYQYAMVLLAIMRTHPNAQSIAAS